MYAGRVHAVFWQWKRKRRHSRLDLVAVAVDDESQLEELLWALRLSAGGVPDYGGVVDCRFAA